MDMMSLWVTGDWEPVRVQSESSNHSAMLFTSARFLTFMEKIEKSKKPILKVLK